MIVYILISDTCLCPCFSVLGWFDIYISNLLYLNLKSTVIFFSFHFISCLFAFKKKDFIYFQREGKRGRKRERETSMCEKYIDWLPPTHLQLGVWPTTQACVLSGNRTGDLLVRRLALSPLSHTSQGCLPFFKNFLFALISLARGVSILLIFSK